MTFFYFAKPNVLWWVQLQDKTAQWGEKKIKTKKIILRFTSPHKTTNRVELKAMLANIFYVYLYKFY